MKNILERIITDKIVEVEALKEEHSHNLSKLKDNNKLASIDVNRRDKLAPHSVERKTFTQKIEASDTIQIIAEIKRGSPSKGLFAPNLDVPLQAKHYEDLGAAAISVLTDAKHFYGGLEDLVEVREVVKLPLLCKDFIIDEHQIDLAASNGANIILLIVAVHDKRRLLELLEYAKSKDLEVLMEVHDKKELEIALSLNPHLIGINNRNLKTFETSIETSLTLIKEVTDPNIIMISESGIKSKDDVERLAEAGFKGILVGESFIREGHNGHLLESMTSIKRGV